MTVNPFADQVQQLHSDTRACLQAVYLGHGASLPDIEAAARAGPMQPHLKRLVDLGLVVLKEGRWVPTWSGRGVYNWSQQILWAEATDDAEIPIPRPHENGDQLVAGCQEYRPVYSCPGRCWCGHSRSDHASEAPKTAAKFLAHKREQSRREALLSRTSGRSVQELYGKLYEDQLLALQVVHRHRAEGISATEVGKALRPRLEGGVLDYVNLQVGEKLLERLAQLDLVLADHGGSYWFPTFDGAGVVNWSRQLIFPGPHPELRLGENGDWMALQPCDQYRAFLGVPDSCWCGYSRLDHNG